LRAPVLDAGFILETYPPCRSIPRPDWPGTREPVVTGQAIPVEQHPHQAGAGRREAEHRPDQSPHGIPWPQRGAVFAHESQAPGAHTECLAAADPEEDEEQADYRDQVKLQSETVERLVVGEGYAHDEVVRDDEEGNRDHEDTEEEHQVIEEGGQAAENAGDGCWSGVRVHGSVLSSCKGRSSAVRVVAVDRVDQG